MAPGWTSYRNRLRFASHDVTELLRDGANAIGAIVGDGWARGRLGFSGARNFYTDRPGAAGAARDHPCRRIYADARHRCRMVYQRRTSARLRPVRRRDPSTRGVELGGWSQPGYGAGGWRPVEVIDHDLATLTPAAVPPVRAVQEVGSRVDRARALRRDAGRLRPEPGGPGAHSPGRGARSTSVARGYRGDRTPRRGAGGRRVGRAARCAPPRSPTAYICRRRQQSRCGSRASRSTASATPA